MKIAIIITSFLVGFSIFVFAQETPNAYDAQYTPPIDSPLGKPNPGSTKPFSSGGSYYPTKNMLLFEPLWIPRGVFGGTYSRQLTSSGFVATFGIGSQVTRDFLAIDIFNVTWSSNASSNENAMTSEQILSCMSFVSGAPMTQFSLCKYFDYDDMEGSGLEFVFRTQRFDMTLQKQKMYFVDDDLSIVGDNSFRLKANSFYLCYKRIWKGKGVTPFVQTLSYGLGLKTMGHNVINVYERVGTNNQYAQIEHSNEKQNYAPFVTLMFSYSLGLGF